MKGFNLGSIVVPQKTMVITAFRIAMVTITVVVISVIENTNNFSSYAKRKNIMYVFILCIFFFLIVNNKVVIMKLFKSFLLFTLLII